MSVKPVIYYMSINRNNVLATLKWKFLQTPAEKKSCSRCQILSKKMQYGMLIKNLPLIHFSGAVNGLGSVARPTYFSARVGWLR